MRTFFKIISYTFHPIYMLTLGVIFLLYYPVEPRGFIVSDAVYNMPGHNKEIIMWLFLVITTAAPALSILALRWNKIITSLEVSEKRERPIPYFIILIYFCIGYFFLMRAPEGAIPLVLKCLLLSAIITVCVLLLLTRVYKISGHVSGIAGVTGVIFAYHIKDAALPLYSLLGLIVIIGLLATARVGLRQHTQGEVYTGAVLSWLIGFSVYYFEFVV